jgi:D-alanine-D-alanine ligase
MGSSIGVSKAATIDELDRALDDAFGFDEVVVVEEAVRGREIEVAVLGNEDASASVPGEIVPGHEFYDYEDKYLVDGAQLLVPAPLDTVQSDEVRALALDAFRVLRCSGMARVDFFFEEGGRGFLVNEINTIPGFTPISMYPKLWQATGVDYAELIDELVRLAIDRHTRRARFR